MSLLSYACEFRSRDSFFHTNNWVPCPFLSRHLRGNSSQKSRQPKILHRCKRTIGLDMSHFCRSSWIMIPPSNFRSTTSVDYYHDNILPLCCRSRRESLVCFCFYVYTICPGFCHDHVKVNNSEIKLQEQVALNRNIIVHNIQTDHF